MKLRFLGLLLMLVVLVWPQGRAVVDIDTGYCMMSGTFCGGIGLTCDTGLGVGFQYPKFTPSQLFYGGFLVGNSPTTLHDHFYYLDVYDWDWVVRDTLEDVVPPLFNADELYKGSWIDTTRPTPAEGYLVTHYWGARGEQLPAYDDFIILQTYIKNISSSTRTGVYVGVMMDYDVQPSPARNYGRTDAIRRLTFMTPRQTTQNPSCGVKLLEPTTASNLSVIDHALYIYPSTEPTEITKLNFLNGTIRVPTSNREYDWSICVAAGPFTIDPQAQVRVAFAFVGASDTVSLKVNADTAQAWYDRDWRGGVQEEAKHLILHEAIKVHPNPFSQSTRIFYTLPTKGKVVIKAYDASGREVATILNRYIDKTGYVDWHATELPNGVYFLRTDTPNNHYTHKVLLLK